MKKTSERVHEFFCSLTGAGKKFARRTELSDFLGIPRSQATKCFDFLDGKEPKYKAVFDWLDAIGAKLILPGDAPGQTSVDCVKKLEEAQNAITKLRQRVTELEAETRVQQRIIDKAFPSAALSLPKNGTAG